MTALTSSWWYFLTAGRSLFGGSDPNLPNYSVINTDYTSYSVVYMCRPIAGIFKKGTLWDFETQILISFITSHFSSFQNPCGCSPEMGCPPTQLLRQLWGNFLFMWKPEHFLRWKISKAWKLFSSVMKTNNLPWEKLVKTSQTGCEALPKNSLWNLDTSCEPFQMLHLQISTSQPLESQ